MMERIRKVRRIYLRRRESLERTEKITLGTIKTEYKKQSNKFEINKLRKKEKK
jgi:hypothetical protein